MSVKVTSVCHICILISPFSIFISLDLLMTLYTITILVNQFVHLTSGLHPPSSSIVLYWFLLIISLIFSTRIFNTNFKFTWSFNLLPLTYWNLSLAVTMMATLSLRGYLDQKPYNLLVEKKFLYSSPVGSLQIKLTID